MTEKLLKIKVGEYWDEANKKAVPVFQTAFPKKSKDGNVYYEIRQQIFIQEFEPKKKENNGGV